MISYEIQVRRIHSLSICCAFLFVQATKSCSELHQQTQLSPKVSCTACDWVCFGFSSSPALSSFLRLCLPPRPLQVRWTSKTCLAPHSTARAHLHTCSPPLLLQSFRKTRREKRVLFSDGVHRCQKQSMSLPSSTKA